ncbi:ARM repeat-containing protein [Parathielavia appendiculata]|uniref:ARM repeat-containing protein n=1 Tax=Parathielavia appendiculata TaxID=2587402 RepID=A0AAN6TYT3_9PEZI|nr:ARM repeat-containing protein [Parathielavia appendiculata]
MAPRRSSAAEAEEQEPEEGTVKLQFNEPLTWRPGKPIPIDTLLKRLDRLTGELAEMDQEATDAGSLVKVAKDVASNQLLNHKDKGVRAYTACCVVDILRLCAPDAPFTPSQLKDFFNLTVTSIIPSLFDPSNSYNNQHKYALRSLAEIKSIVLLLDVDGSESLLLHLFSTIFDGVSGSKSASGEQVAKDVEYSMQELLSVLVEDATSLPAKVVDVMMAQFLRAAAPGSGREKHNHAPIDDKQATLLAKEEPEAYQIVKHLCQVFPDKMARFVSQYFSDVIVDATNFAGTSGHRDGDAEDDEGPSGPTESDLRELRKAHTLIREIWKAAPQILQNVVPQVDAELSADNVHLRQLATETLGDMISGIGAAGPPPPPTLDPAAYPPLRLDDEDKTEAPAANILTTPLSALSFSQTHHTTFHNFLSRRNDKAAAIRAAWTTAVGYILSTSAGGIGLGREDETALIQGIGEKLSDSDEKVRLAAVKAVECFSFRDVILKLGPSGGVGKEGSVLSTLADRCRDKKPAVRVAAMSLLGKLWGVATGELLAGHEAVTAALGAVPSRIYNSFYANDLELNVLLDRVIYECLVPLAYPPLPKKASKSAASNGSSQAAGAANFDPDAIRAERILLLVRSLDATGKKAFFAMQARRPQFAHVLETYIKQCDQFNGGVTDDDGPKKLANLTKTTRYISQFFPDGTKSEQELYRFAKLNDRRSYNLIKFVIGQEHDFKTVHKALKELMKRIQTSKDPAIRDTLLPLLYRSGCLMFNRSHLATIMEYSRSDKDNMGAAAHEILNEISQRNPDLFKTHIGQLCKDLVDQAPTQTRENDPAIVETLKACSTYAQKYPKDVPADKEFVRTMINYALYGQPARAAKYAVNIMLAKKDEKSLVSATDLLQRTLKDWSYGAKHFLNRLATVSQLELLAPKVTLEDEEKILSMAVQEVLLEVRTEASSKDPDWVDDADLDEECQAKCLALKTLANRLRSTEDVDEAKEKAKPVWKLFMKLVRSKGELSKTKKTPKHHRARLRLLAAQLLLKLCTQKHFDEMLSADDFNAVSLTTQDAIQEVRHGFIKKLQKYLADNKLRSRFYTIVFLMAFEPSADFKQRTETWIRSRARHFQDHKQPVLEAVMPRLLSLLAHHPDYSAELDELVDHARYMLFYVSLVATESNLGLIYKYAERVKQTQDALDAGSNNHQVLSDLAQAVIRNWQEKKNWVFNAYPGRVGLPVGLYTALKSHDEAQAIAEKQLVPDGIDEKLDELLRAMDRKKKRKSVDDRGESHQPSKKARVQSKASATPKEAKSAKSAAPKKAGSTPKPKKTKAKKPETEREISNAERRRSGRSRNANRSYMERDSEDDDEEMLDGVAEWTYENGDGSGSGSEDEGENDGGEDKQEARSGTEDEAEAEAGEKSEQEEEAAVVQEKAVTPSEKKKASTTKAASKSKAKAAPAREEKEEDDKSGSELSKPEEGDIEMEDANTNKGEEEEEQNEEKADEDEDENQEDEEESEASPPPPPSRNTRKAKASASAAPARKAKRAAAKSKAAPKAKPATAKGAEKAAEKAAPPAKAGGRATRGRK